MLSEHQHAPYKDEDSDIVCGGDSGCRMVLSVGPLGINGITPSGYDFGGRSSLARVARVYTGSNPVSKRKGAD